jgi:hypothetical protein
MNLGLIAGIVMLILLCAAMYVIYTTKPGQTRRRDRAIDDE